MRYTSSSDKSLFGCLAIIIVACILVVLGIIRFCGGCSPTTRSAIARAYRPR